MPASDPCACLYLHVLLPSSRPNPWPSCHQSANMKISLPLISTGQPSAPSRQRALSYSKDPCQPLLLRRLLSFFFTS
ncbi:hypothetical protein M440DRAFT_1242146 [Trichoderma longibrachiatum ATCC 18648]|uniref:Uncharacterized protein n=1 Tax=Trichoderma longibrachiatum ATCC 18648 TaxID=983965 RepID=A0A2T4C685_TRILO|nr:hypothetical protein M440DRAFT_1242146 [Trichoderma longibrachiatum ATCC 18648]